MIDSKYKQLLRWIFIHYLHKQIVNANSATLFIVLNTSINIEIETEISLSFLQVQLIDRFSFLD